MGAATIDLSYRERLFYWIRTVFPNQNHTFHNGALAAAPSSYMSQCIHDFAPPHSDLVFVEVRSPSWGANCWHRSGMFACLAPPEYELRSCFHTRTLLCSSP